VGCQSDFDCPEPVTEPWGTCEGSGCALEGTHSRAVTSYTCMDNVCAPSTIMELEACGRDTDDEPCSPPMQGSWTNCDPISSLCDLSGTRSREIRTPICEDGSCTGLSISEETESCPRNTNGQTCDTVYGPWSGCGGFTFQSCEENGTKSRTVTTMTCASGACSNAASQISETDSCTRNTDGNFCSVRTQTHICSGECQDADCDYIFGCEPLGFNYR
jgi:hypothetical protein